MSIQVNKVVRHCKCKTLLPLKVQRKLDIQTGHVTLNFQTCPTFFGPLLRYDLQSYFLKDGLKWGSSLVTHTLVSLRSPPLYITLDLAFSGKSLVFVGLRNNFLNMVLCQVGKVVDIFQTGTIDWNEDPKA